MTVSEFKEKYPRLKNYTTVQIGKALDKLGIKLEKKRIDGSPSRVRYLPDIFIKSEDFNNL